MAVLVVLTHIAKSIYELLSNRRTQKTYVFI